MTDKQIIIDGLACVNCPEAKRCQEQQAKKEYAINQVLQDIPAEYANVIARLKQIIPSVTRCDYVLEKQLKAKEQECEKLKLDLIEAKAHGDYLNNLTLSETLNLVSEQLDQLKTENEGLKEEAQYLKSEIERIGEQ